MLGSRNQRGLTEAEIDYCQLVWEYLCGDSRRRLDASQAHGYGSRTRFLQRTNTVMLGADAYPGVALTANARLSPMACLAHEIAHMERYEMGYERPFKPPDNYIDEAETSLRASFTSILSSKDREDLIEDARDRLIDWLASTGGKNDDPN